MLSDQAEWIHGYASIIAVPLEHSTLDGLHLRGNTTANVLFYFSAVYRDILSSSLLSAAFRVKGVTRTVNHAVPVLVNVAVPINNQRSLRRLVE